MKPDRLRRRDSRVFGLSHLGHVNKLGSAFMEGIEFYLGYNIWNGKTPQIVKTVIRAVPQSRPWLYKESTAERAAGRFRALARSGDYQSIVLRVHDNPGQR